MSHVQFVTGLLLISPKQKFVKQFLFCLSSSMKFCPVWRRILDDLLYVLLLKCCGYNSVFGEPFLSEKSVLSQICLDWLVAYDYGICFSFNSSHLYTWVKRSNIWLSVLFKDTGLMTGIRAHTPMLSSLELESNVMCHNTPRR